MNRSRSTTQADSLARILVLIVVSAGFYLRINGINRRSLEYDEIWTLLHYVAPPGLGVIFQDLATPNNHLLHSLLVRWTVRTLGETQLLIRLPALVAGTLVIAAAAWLTWLLVRSRSAAVVAATLCAGSGVLVHYGRIARGYSLQTLCLLVAIICVVRLLQEPDLKRPLGWGIGLAVSMVAAVLTLPTSVLYLAVMSGVALIMVAWPQWRQARDGGAANDDEQCPSWGHHVGKRRFLYGGLVAGWLLSGLWLAVSLRGLLQGRATFGQRLETLPELGQFLLAVREPLVSWPVLLLALAAAIAKPSRRSALPLLLVALVPVLLAPLSLAGAPRVYQAGVPLLMIGATLGLWALQERVGRQALPIAGTLLVALVAWRLPASLDGWTPIDWPAVFLAEERETAPETYLVYPATAGFVIVFHQPQAAVERHYQRVITPSRQLELVGETRHLSVVDADHQGEERWPLSASGPYRLVPVEEQPQGDILVVMLEPVRLDIYRAWRDWLLDEHPGEWGILNNFLTRRVETLGATLRGGVFVNRDGALSREAALEGVARADGMLRCYWLVAE